MNLGKSWPLQKQRTEKLAGREQAETAAAPWPPRVTVRMSPVRTEMLRSGRSRN